MGEKATDVRAAKARRRYLERQERKARILAYGKARSPKAACQEFDISLRSYQIYDSELEENPELAQFFERATVEMQRQAAVKYQAEVFVAFGMTLNTCTDLMVRVKGDDKAHRNPKIIAETRQMASALGELIFTRQMISQGLQDDLVIEPEPGPTNLLPPAPDGSDMGGAPPVSDQTSGMVS